MDLKNAIKEIQETAVKAARKQVVCPDAEPSHVYFMLNESGEYERTLAAARPRRHQFDKIDDLLLFSRDRDNPHEAVPTIWCSADGVELLLDSNDRRDSAFIRFDLTALARAVAVAGPTICAPRDPKAFLRLLLVTLAGALPPESTLVALIRDTKWSVGSSGNANVQHGKESMGREVEAEVSAGAGAIPEQVLLSFPLFKGLTQRVTINCALEIDPHDQTLWLTPFPDACDNEIDRVVSEIATYMRKELDASECPVYLGSPTPRA